MLKIALNPRKIEAKYLLLDNEFPLSHLDIELRYENAKIRALTFT